MYSGDLNSVTVAVPPGDGDGPHGRDRTPHGRSEDDGDGDEPVRSHGPVRS